MTMCHRLSTLRFSCPMLLTAGLLSLVMGAQAPVLVGAERLTDAREPLAKPAPSPDGHWVAYLATTESGPAVRVAPLPPSATLQHAMASGPVDTVVGDLTWVGEPFPLLWVTERGTLWLMHEDGSVGEYSLPAPPEMRGYVWDRERQLLIAYNRSLAYEYVLPPTGVGTMLPLGGANADVSSVIVGPTPGTLVCANAGRVDLRGQDGSIREILSPGLTVEEYVSVHRTPEGHHILAVARSRGAATASVLVRLDGSARERTQVSFGDYQISAVAPVTADLVVVEAGQRLWLADLGAERVCELPSEGSRDVDPAITADGKLLLFVSSGREDLDLDGQVTEADPANLYSVPVTKLLAVLSTATP